MLIHFTRLIAVIITFTTAPLLAGELVLNGISQQNYFNEPAYLGALFIGKRSTDAAAIKAQSGEKLIEFHFVNSRYPVRIFLDHIIAWSDANTPKAKSDFLSINGSIRELTARRNFVKGDILTVRLSHTNTSEIALNKTALINTNDNQLFNYIAAAWMGNNPANAEFKQGILVMDINDSITQNMISEFYEPLGKVSIATLAQRGVIPAIDKSLQQTKTLAVDTTINTAKISPTSTHNDQFYTTIKNKMLASLQKEITDGSLKDIEAVKIYFNQSGKVITAAPITSSTLGSNDANNLKLEIHDEVITAAKNISPIPISKDMAYSGIFSLSVVLH